MNLIDPAAVLNCPLARDPNGRFPAGLTTIGDGLRATFLALWDQGDDFSGKRPFGNSGWRNLFVTSLVAAGMIHGTIDPDGCLERLDPGEGQRADDSIRAAIESLF